MRNTFFTADWHCFHENVLKYDQRPFASLEEMHKTLIKNYNKLVGENDLCYFLGDVSLKNPKLIVNIISSLNGTKILIKGNHDRNEQGLIEAGFAAVLYGASLKIGGEKVTLSHCPLRGVFREDTTGMVGAVEGDHWHGESPLGKLYSTANEGQFHLHGHIHSGPHNNKDVILGRQMDVGVAAHKYMPVSIQEVESWISKTKNQIG